MASRYKRGTVHCTLPSYSHRHDQRTAQRTCHVANCQTAKITAGYFVQQNVTIIQSITVMQSLCTVLLGSELHQFCDVLQFCVKNLTTAKTNMRSYMYKPSFTSVQC